MHQLTLPLAWLVSPLGACCPSPPSSSSSSPQAPSASASVTSSTAQSHFLITVPLRRTDPLAAASPPEKPSKRPVTWAQRRRDAEAPRRWSGGRGGRRRCAAAPRLRPVPERTRPKRRTPWY